LTKEGKDKLIVGIITAFITGGLALVAVLLTKPSVTNIVLPGGQTVNADGIVALQSENAELRERLTVQANAISNPTLPPVTTVTSLYLLDKASPLSSSTWRLNDGNPIDTRGNRLASNVSYVVASSWPTWGGESWAEYAIDGQYRMLHCDVAPHETMSSSIGNNNSVGMKISVKREGKDTLEQVYPKEGENLAITTATKAFAIDVALGDDVEYMRIEFTDMGWLLLWNLRLYN